MVVVSDLARRGASAVAEGLWVGQHVVRAGRRWRVVGVAPEGVTLEGLEGERECVPASQLVLGQDFVAYADGSWLRASASLAHVDLSRVSSEDLSGAIVLARHLEEVLRGVPCLVDESPPTSFRVRARYRPDVPKCKRVEAKVEELAAVPGLRMSVRTLHRRLAAYEAFGLAGLLPKSGAVKQVRARRTDATYIKVLASQIERELRGPKRSMDVVLRATLSVLRSNEQYASVRVPSPSTQRRLFKDLSRVHGVGGEMRKYTQSAQSRPRRSSTGPVKTVLPGERVEVDATVVNVRVRDPLTGGVFRPTLTVLVDVATRTVVGLALVRVDDHTVLARALLDAMTPKPQVEGVERQAQVDCLGLPPEVVQAVYPQLADAVVGHEGPMVFPRTLVIDQGKSFHNVQSRMMLDRLGVAVELARKRSPTDKPHVERWFRTLESMLELLPGYTARSVVDRGSVTTKEDVGALLTLQQLEAAIRAWIALEYHVRPHDSLRVPLGPGEHVPVSPLAMYRLLVDQHGFIPAPLDPGLRFLLMDVQLLQIGAAGIHLNNLTYDAPSLDDLRGVACPWTRNGKWQVHFDARDCRQVFVRVPSSHGQLWLEVPWKHMPSAICYPFPHRVMSFLLDADPVDEHSDSTPVFQKRGTRRIGRADREAARAKRPDYRRDPHLIEGQVLGFMRYIRDVLGSEGLRAQHHDKSVQLATSLFLDAVSAPPISEKSAWFDPAPLEDDETSCPSVDIVVPARVEAGPPPQTGASRSSAVRSESSRPVAGRVRSRGLAALRGLVDEDDD